MTTQMRPTEVSRAPGQPLPNGGERRGRPAPSSWSSDAVLGVLAAGAVVSVAWPVGLMASAGPLQLAALVAHVCGMAAGYGVVALIALMSRTPALERGVGADRLARWHSRGGRAVVALVIVHASAAVVAWAQSRQQSLGLAAWHVLRLPWLIAATIGTLLLLVVGVLSVRAARRHVRYETWHTIHLLVYLAVALGFVHQLGGPDLAGHRIPQLAWALLYTQSFALVAKHRILTPIRNAGRHRMRVTAVVPEGPGVVSVHIAGEHLAELFSEPGQFFRWRFLTPDLWATAHPFSLSAAPTGTTLRLTVKDLGDGSGHIQHVEVGTWVLAEGPYGALTAASRTRPDVLLIAGGVGITPMRALFETMPLAPGCDMLLLYRARSEADLLFRAELDEISRRRGVRVHYLLGSAVGPFTAEMFRWFAPNVADRDVYVCGPPGMSVAVRRELRRAGLPDQQLHEERFGS